MGIRSLFLVDPTLPEQNGVHFVPEQHMSGSVVPLDPEPLAPYRIDVILLIIFVHMIDPLSKLYRVTTILVSTSCRRAGQLIGD